LVGANGDEEGIVSVWIGEDVVDDGLEIFEVLFGFEFSEGIVDGCRFPKDLSGCDSGIVISLLAMDGDSFDFFASSPSSSESQAKSSSYCCAASFC